MTTHFRQRLYNQTVSEALAHAGILRPIAQALSARGVEGPEDLDEGWIAMLAPELLEGTAEAAAILAGCRGDGTHVVIVADYDCDGATACAIAMRGFAMMGISASYIVPDRFHLGYGLSPEIVDMAAAGERKPGLIITVDNGIASVEGVRRARELGIRVIITDHHLQGDELPEADCIVNPNVRGSSFASKSLAGCGVMYYVLLALRAELRRRGVYSPESQPQLAELADLAALGTVADVVPLDKNNRVIVSQGLRRVRRGRACPGIRALFEVAGKDCGTASVRDFGFSIAPRINAAGRLSNMRIGIECLLAESREAALPLAEELDSLNAERRSLEETMQTDAAGILEHIDWRSHSTITLFDESWHQGVVGLVASRLKEKTNRPVIAFARDEGGLIKGSGRSIQGIHLRDSLDRVSKLEPDLIVRFGGHAMAAGLTIREKDLLRFRDVFDRVVTESAGRDAFSQTVYVDGALAPGEISFPLAEALAGRIWGQGFEAPLFANEFTVISQRILKDAHLKLKVAIGSTKFEAIFFRRNMPLARQVRLAYRPEINEWNGRRMVQLVVEAVEEA